MGRRERLAEILARENEKSALVNKVRSPHAPCASHRGGDGGPCEGGRG